LDQTGRACQTAHDQASHSVITTKADYTDEEWVRLERAPLVAAWAITDAGSRGPIKAMRGSVAAVKAVIETAQVGGRGELVDAVAASVTEKAGEGQKTLGGFKPRRADAEQDILRELGAVNELLSRKATPEEAAAFREWLLAAAKRAAASAKEGVFKRSRAKRVSEDEQRMLEHLGEVLSRPAA
jgi:hypothetical protein